MKRFDIRLRHWLLLALTLWITGIEAAPVRQALVIGNAAYMDESPLANTLNDARDVADKLRALGFEVTLKENLSGRDMRRTINRFLGRMERQDGIALLYFSGHGVQNARQANYLLPVDARIEGPYDVAAEGIAVDPILENLSQRPAGSINLLVLDACRNNPFAQGLRSVSRGLARIGAPPGGSLVLYAASPGQTASDNPGQRNGLFTAKLLEVLDRPGLDIEDAFEEAALAVKQASGDRQVPYKEGNLLGKHYLAGARAPNPSSSTNESAVNLELEVWRSAEQCGSPACVKAYLDQYPEGRFAGVARARLADDTTNQPRSPGPIPFRVQTIPEDARVRILNITPKYRDEIPLPPGRYQVEVSRSGYRTHLAWFDLTPKENRYWVELEPLSPPAARQPAPIHSGPTEENPGRSWRMVTSYPKGFPALGTQADAFAKRLQGASRIRISVHGAGEIVPAMMVFDAVANGTTEAGWSTAGYWTAKNGAMEFLTSYPDLDTVQFVDWSMSEESQRIRDLLFHPHGIHAIACGATGPKGDFWLDRALGRPQDLTGLKIRTTGLQKTLLSQLGVNTQLLPGGEILEALQQGYLNGTHWSTPHLDKSLGLYKVVENYYYPSTTEHATLLELMIGKPIWDALGTEEHDLIDNLCRENLKAGLAKSQADDQQALDWMEKDAGVSIQPLPESIRRAIDTAWQANKADKRRDDPITNQLLESLDGYQGR